MSELRKDPVSGEWIIIAPGRARRPHNFSEKEQRIPGSKDTCPFEDLAKSGNPVIYSVGAEEGSWSVAVTPNKFPVLEYSETCPTPIFRGPYALMEGRGHHELVITRDHEKNFTKLSLDEAVELLNVFKSRYEEISKDECVNYISLLHNWGPNAGASVYHPHYQILALPIIPPDISRSLEGSEKYLNTNGKCVHCSMLEFEKSEGKRIIYENEGFMVVAPFVSRQPFEIRVFPKVHASHFADTDPGLMRQMGDALKTVLHKLESNLNDPDYNFFIHTPPFGKEKKYEHYHWHMEILPKTSIWGGFEWSTGITVNIVDPDETAEILRK